MAEREKQRLDLLSVRVPFRDVGFISWDLLAGGRRASEAIHDLVRDLSVEVVS